MVCTCEEFASLSPGMFVWRVVVGCQILAIKPINLLTMRVYECYNELFWIFFLPIFIEFQLFLHNIFSLGFFLIFFFYLLLKHISLHINNNIIYQAVKTNNTRNGNDLLSFGTVTCPSLPYLQKVWIMLSRNTISRPQSMTIICI